MIFKQKKFCVLVFYICILQATYKFIKLSLLPHSMFLCAVIFLYVGFFYSYRYRYRCCYRYFYYYRYYLAFRTYLWTQGFKSYGLCIIEILGTGIKCCQCQYRSQYGKILMSNQQFSRKTSIMCRRLKYVQFRLDASHKCRAAEQQPISEAIFTVV